MAEQGKDLQLHLEIVVGRLPTSKFQMINFISGMVHCNGSAILSVSSSPCWPYLSSLLPRGFKCQQGDYDILYLIFWQNLTGTTGLIKHHHYHHFFLKEKMCFSKFTRKVGNAKHPYVSQLIKNTDSIWILWGFTSHSRTYPPRN